MHLIAYRMLQLCIANSYQNSSVPISTKRAVNTMRALLIIVCLCLASTQAQREERVKQELSDAFNVHIDDVTNCFNKTEATAHDFNALDEVARYPEIDIDDASIEGGARRASCAFACIAQVNGTMIGAKMQIDKLHSLIDARDQIPEGDKAIARKIIDTCYEVVKDETDECAVGLKFITCLNVTRKKLVRQGNI